MKKSILTLIILTFCKVIIAGTSNSTMNESSNALKNTTSEESLSFINSGAGTMVINSSDTLIFDMSRAIISGNHIEIPVRILSDDIIYAVDFSFKYNHSNLVYDSITNLTNYIQPLSFYNPNDSTLRFTSSSLQSYQNDSALVNVHFTMLNTQIQPSDLISIKAYLNGDKCSIKVVNPTLTGIEDHHINSNDVKVFPNPVKGMLTVECTKKAKLEFTDINGRNIFMSRNLSGLQNEVLDLQQFNNGVYLIKIQTDKEEIVKKVIVEN